MTDKEYDLAERLKFQADLQRVEKQPLADRREAAAEFAKDLANNPQLVAERIGWLLQGCYGYGSYAVANELMPNMRANRQAWLCQTIAALEWGCSQKDAVKAWKQLTSEQQAELAKLVQAEIDYAEAEKAQA